MVVRKLNFKGLALLTSIITILIELMLIKNNIDIYNVIGITMTTTLITLCILTKIKFKTKKELVHSLK